MLAFLDIFAFARPDAIVAEREEQTAYWFRIADEMAYGASRPSHALSTSVFWGAFCMGTVKYCSVRAGTKCGVYVLAREGSRETGQ
jgi:hypothetical protein